MRTYVTLLSTLSYLPGVVGLNHSLRQTGTSYPLLVAVSADMDPSVDARLKEQGMDVLRLPPSLALPRAIKDKSGHWGHTFDKLHLFDLTEFSKLVYLDSDMMILTNIDELFDKPHMSAVAAGRRIHADWTRLNSGLMVIEPEQGLSSRIASMLDQAMEEAAARGVRALGDQDLINAYYPDWPQSSHLHLDDGYNVFFNHADRYIEAHNYQFPGDEMPSAKKPDSGVIRVLHFVGANKPWMPWAPVRHFKETWRNRQSSRWERRAFGMYRQLLAQVG
jgi:glycogenin glucosyltransferase